MSLEDEILESEGSYEDLIDVENKFFMVILILGLFDASYLT